MSKSLSHEQADAVAHSQAFALAINSLLAATVFPVLHTRDDQDVLIFWIGLVIGVNCLRFVIIRTYFVFKSDEAAHRFLTFSCLGATISGVIWASLPLLFLNSANPQSFFLLVILCGISAGGTVLGASHLPTSLGFSTPVLAASIIALLRIYTRESEALAFDVSLYFAFLLRCSMRSQSSFNKMVQLREESTNLARDFFKLANTDPLTELPNRARFATVFKEWIVEATTGRQTFFLLLIDLDHFKDINDTLGHSAGDLVLKKAAERLLGAVAGSRNIVARLGGDEFAILVPARPGDDGTTIADHVITAVSGPVVDASEPVAIELSIGIAKIPQDGVNGDDLLGRADLALYAAKNGGRQRSIRFDDSLARSAKRMRDIEQDLPQAMADGALQVWYRPQVDLNTEALCGVEALIRWHHPSHGWIKPATIIKAAGRKKSSITEFVLRNACGTARLLDEAGYFDTCVAVDIAPSEFVSGHLTDLVARMLTSHHLKPDRLMLEITEETLVSNVAAIACMQAISRLGVRLSIDDFAGGCSSISYLRAIRVNRIKIDESFVAGFVERPADQLLVQAILSIGRSMNVEVMAAGVECTAEAELLKHLDCKLAQGNLFGRPMTSGDLLLWLQRRACRAEAAA